MQLTTIQMVSVWILPIIFAVTVHEVAHGYVAYLLGDKTARVFGRLTLNPIKHIDLFGTIIVPIALLLLGGIIIGWAKPVPITSRNLRKPKRDLALIAAAGPVSNLVMALIWALIAKGGAMLIATHNFPGALAIYVMGSAGVSINLMLMALNLLPIPPLDGGHILSGILPRSISIHYQHIAPYGFFILLALLAVGVVNIVIDPVINVFGKIISAVFGLNL